MTQVDIEAKREQLLSRLKQDGAAHQSCTAQYNQVGVALKAAEERTKKGQVGFKPLLCLF